jgi:glycerophosphoryl diester phosphodiesterase
MLKYKNRLLPRVDYPLLYAHRGCSTAAPENTLPAFRKVKEFGIPGVELDVQLCSTGELMVFHDSNLKRTTGLDAELADTDYKTLRELDAGAWFGKEFSGEKIPTFEEVLDCLGEAVYYDIEIKNWDRRKFPIEQALISIIRKRDIGDRVVVSSFNPYSLRAVKRLNPEIKTALIYTKHPGFPAWLNRGAGRFICRPHYLKPNRHRLNPFVVFWKKKILGYPLVTWTEDDEDAVRHYLELGVDGIISNRPEKFLDMIREFSNKRTAPNT